MRRRFFANLLVGLGLLALFHIPAVENNVLVSRARDAAISWQMNALAGSDSGNRVAWIALDDATRARFPQDYTPRPVIAKLLSFALRGRPAAVLLDFDLGPRRDEGDMELARLLRTLPAHCAPACPAVVLPRDLRVNPALAYAEDPAQPAQAAMASYLDEAAASGKAVFGSSDMPPEQDQSVPYWSLWIDSCAHAGRADPVPSMMLLAAAAVTHTPASTVREALARVAARCVPLGDPGAVQSEPPTTTLRLGTHDVTLSHRRVEQRIFYRIMPGRSAQFVRMSAADILDDPHADPALLRGRVVVIGADSSSEDVHATPLGTMPGSLILVNAVNTLLAGAQLHDNVWLAIAVELVLICIVSLLFARLAAGAALAASLAVIAFGVLTVGFWAFNSGVWVDSVLPTLGVIGHEVVHAVQHRIHARRRVYKH